MKYLNHNYSSAQNFRTTSRLQNNTNTAEIKVPVSKLAKGSALIGSQMELPMEVRRMFRFLHSAPRVTTKQSSVPAQGIDR